MTCKNSPVSIKTRVLNIHPEKNFIERILQITEIQYYSFLFKKYFKNFTTMYCMVLFFIYIFV